MRRVAAGTAARGRSGTRRRVFGGHSRCHETTTCARDPAHCELPGDRRDCRSEPDCGPSSRAVHGTPAGRTTESKKNFCCVTTRRRNLTVTRCLGRGLGALTARTFRLGMLRFDFRILPSCRLPPRRLPAADLPQTLGILAVMLVPTPRLVLTSAAFAQADPRARTSRSGTTAALWITVVGAHGSPFLPGTARGECATVLSGRLYE